MTMTEEHKTKSEKMAILSIVVLTYNALKYTKEMLKTVIKHTKTPFELIIIDNNSSDKTQEYLIKFMHKNKKLPISLILNSDNEGVAGGRNQGIEYAKGAYIVFLDNDVEVSEGWEKRIIQLFESDSNIWVVGHHGNHVQCYNPLSFSDTLKYKDISQLDVVAGYCFAFPRQILKYIGNQYTGLGKFWHEDLEFCGRVRKYGKRVMEDKKIPIIHHWHKSAGEEIDGDAIKLKFKGFNEKARKVGHRLEDANILTIYRDYRNPYAAYEIIANNLTNYLRKTNLVVLRKPELAQAGEHNSKSFDLCNGFNMVLGSKRLVYLHVENSKPPEDWVEDMESVDYAFTVNPDAYQSLIDIGVPKEKLINFALTGFNERVFNYDVEPMDDKEFSEIANPDYFTFLNVGASQPRKGQDILIEAFVQEFEKHEPVQLLIKNYGYGKKDWVDGLISRHDSNHAPISHVFEDWDEYKLATLYKRVAQKGAYCSPHRAEGFGMPHVEAVACGLRVGYTNFGGPKSNLAGLDTCTEFGYELEPSFYHNHLGEPFYGFGENPQWARPNIEEVKAWMRAVYEERIGSTTVNSKKVINKFGFEAVAKGFHNHLEEIKKC